MINVSRAFRQAVAEDREYLVDVEIGIEDGPILDIGKMDPEDRDIMEGGLSIDDAVSSDSNFDIGAAIINRCTLTLNNIYDEFSEYDFTDARVVPYIGLRLPDGTVERVRKGTFTVDDAKYNGSVITLSCLDDMVRFDKPYSLSSLIYPATLGAIIRDACDVCGVPLQTYSFPHSDFVVKERPSDEATTFREVISWVAQIACCFCRCDVYGRLELRWYDQEALEAADLDGGEFDEEDPSIYLSGDDADGGGFRPWDEGDVFDGGSFEDLKGIYHIYALFSMDISMDDVVITGVRVLEKTRAEGEDAITTYQSGSDGYVISIEGNGLIQGGAGRQIADWVGAQLIGFRFRRASVSHLSDPTIEAGDVGFLSDRKGNTYRVVASSTKFKVGATQTTSSSAKTPARNSADRFSSDTKNYVENRKATKQEISFYDKTVQNMTKLISQGFGMYFTSEPQEDGSSKWFLHDKPTIKESSYVWQMTSNGLMVSTDGGTVWAVDRNGNALYNVITARGINADWINAGSISITTQAGKETFYADTETGIVRIVANEFSLAGKSISDIAQEATETRFTLVDGRITTEVTRATQAEGKLETKITQNANDITAQVKRTTELGESIANIKITAENVTSTVTSLTKSGGTLETMQSQITQNANDITLKVTAGEVNSLIEQKADSIRLKADKISWSSTYSSMTEGGVLTCTSGTIGGFTISSSKIYGTSGNNKTIVMQKGNSGTSTAFAAGGSSHDNYSDCPFRVNMAGKLFATGAEIKGDSTFAGELKGASGTFSGSLSAATGTFAGELKAATGTFKGSLSAATGTFSGNVTATTFNATGHIHLNGVQAGTRDITVMATTGDKQIVLKFKDGLYMGHDVLDL